jgi:hypothetical protein
MFGPEGRIEALSNFYESLYARCFALGAGRFL